VAAPPNWVATTVPDSYADASGIRADAGGASLKLRIREYVGNNLVGQATNTITRSISWQQVTVTCQPTSPGSTLDFNAYVSNAPAGARCSTRTTHC
jgi:hypothetical protein